jgi:enoyl-CoA hydratase/carnithine racemase
VHGHALGGGCELALCCDLIVAAESAKFGQPEIKLAAIAPVAALRMPESIGYRRAAEMLLAGEPIDATEAARIGLINHAVSDADLDETAGQIVARLSALSAIALRMCKRALKLGTAGWANVPALETLYLDELMPTEDASEGLAAFMEKRRPAWKHR